MATYSVTLLIIRERHSIIVRDRGHLNAHVMKIELIQYIW